jgi:hypothetical protein
LKACITLMRAFFFAYLDLREHMSMIKPENLSQVVMVRLQPADVCKLDTLVEQTCRPRSYVIRLLLRQAELTHLSDVCLTEKPLTLSRKKLTRQKEPCHAEE